MMFLFLSAFGLGLIFNAAPGAVFAESLRRGLHGGYQAALNVQIGSLVGDATWAVLGLAGAGVLFQLPGIRIPLTVIGSLYLGYIGIKSILSSKQSAATNTPSQKTVRQSALGAGISLSLTNPANVFYWGALGGVLGGLGIATPMPAHYVVFFSGFMVSSFVWCFICAGMIHLLHRTMSPAYSAGLNILCGLALIYLSVSAAIAVFFPG